MLKRLALLLLGGSIGLVVDERDGRIGSWRTKEGRTWSSYEVGGIEGRQAGSEKTGDWVGKGGEASLLMAVDM